MALELENLPVLSKKFASLRWQLPNDGHQHAPDHRRVHQECEWEHDVTRGKCGVR